MEVSRMDAALAVALVLCALPASAAHVAAGGRDGGADVRDASLVGWWTFDSATAQGAVPPRTGDAAGSFDPSSAALRPLGVAGSNATALRLFGNASAGFAVPRDRAIDGLKEVSVALWLNNFWGDTTLIK
jgi:hypothetical protein